MTREEAWNRIDSIIATHETDDVCVCLTNEKDYDALRIAREILKQEPYTEYKYCPSCGTQMKERGDENNGRISYL